MTIIGERAYVPSHYRKHAPAATYQFQDGDGVDAGSAIDIDHNTSHLQLEGCRQLFSSLGDAAESFKTQGEVYLGYEDAQVPVFGSATPQHQQIFWGERDCRVFGPFDGIADRPGAAGIVEGRALLRMIRANVDLFIGAASVISSDLYFAVTQSADPSLLFAGNYLVFLKKSLGAATGRQTDAEDLNILIPHSPAMESRWTSRATGSSGATTSRVNALYVWIGWRFLNSANTTCYINSMSGREIRTGAE